MKSNKYKPTAKQAGQIKKMYGYVPFAYNRKKVRGIV
jgi:hypothetical protein